MMTLTRTRCKELCPWYIEDHISLFANSWWSFRVSCILYQWISSYSPGPLRQTTSWKMPTALHPGALQRQPRRLPQQPSTPSTMTCHSPRVLRCLAVGVWIRICWCRGHMRWILEVIHARCRIFHPGHMRHDTVEEHEEMRMWMVETFWSLCAGGYTVIVVWRSMGVFQRLLLGISIIDL